MNIILQEAILDGKLTVRQRATLFLAFLFPLMLLILFCSVFGGTPEDSTGILAGLISITSVSGALYGIGLVLVAYREGKILRRYKLAPIKLWKIILGVCLSRVITISITTAVMMVISRVYYNVTLPTRVGAFLVVFLTGTFMFCTISFAIASVAKTAPQANLIVQIIFLPMTFLSGSTLPYEAMPSWMQKLSLALPATYNVRSLKLILSGGGLEGNWENLVVMSVFSLFCIAFSVKFFRWE
jgi:ABC-2 type transport system permease protein